MFYHIVRIALKDELSEAERQECFSWLLRLNEMDSVLTSYVGRNLSIPDDGYSHTIVVTFTSPDSFAAYQDDPIHIGMAKYCIPRCAKMEVLDTTDDWKRGWQSESSES